MKFLDFACLEYMVRFY